MKMHKTLKFTGKDPGIVGYEKQKLLNELYQKLKKQKKTITQLNETLNGKTPNILIGSHNYPELNTGFLTGENVTQEDTPKDWTKKETTITDIILLRQNLTNSRFKTKIKTTNQFSDKLKEVSLSSKAIDTEIKLDGKLKEDFNINLDTLPHGPTGALKNITINENPKIPFHVQRAESDTDLKAQEALTTLNQKGINEHYLTKIISAGNLGLKTNRKIVPTKWSITLIDDTLGKNHIDQIRHNEETQPTFLEGNYLGNYFYALIFPGPWSFELFETYTGDITNSTNYESATDYENAYGRTKYAENTAGGYYASRLPTLEYLKNNKIKGRILLLRFITKEYWAPLGVWVVREATRNTYKNTPTYFENNKDLLDYAFKRALIKFKINLYEIYRKSKLLNDIKTQKTLI